MRFVRFITAAAALTVVGVVLPAHVVAQETAAKKPPVMSHTTEGRANCMMCHSGKMQGMKAAPANHAGRANDTCTWCHAADAVMQTKEAKAIPHSLEGKDNCLMCHSGKMANIPAPSEAAHKGISDVKTCGYCHTVKS